MVDEIRQKVTLTVTEDDKTGTFEIERWQNWPGGEAKDIATLIDEVASSAKKTIWEAENFDGGS